MEEIRLDKTEIRMLNDIVDVYNPDQVVLEYQSCSGLGYVLKASFPQKNERFKKCFTTIVLCDEDNW